MRPVRRSAAVAMVVTTLLLTPALPGASAERAERAKPTPQAELRKLTKQAAALNKRYRGQVQSLEEVQVQAKKATARARALQRSLSQAEREVARFAQTTYMGGTLDSAQLFGMGGNPSIVLGQAATVTHLASERARQLDKVRDLVTAAKKARKAAENKIVNVRKEIRTLKAKRRDIEKLLAKHGFQSPGGSDGLTPRMVSIRNTILSQFPMPYGYGCLRPGDPGEHGSGRACDFMMSSGGRMPGQIDSERGDALAEWAVANGSRVGIMYIIWKQRFYDIRTGAGWRPMSDRGSITANHWDHVHISVF